MWTYHCFISQRNQLFSCRQNSSAMNLILDFSSLNAIYAHLKVISRVKFLEVPNICNLEIFILQFWILDKLIFEVLYGSLDCGLVTDCFTIYIKLWIHFLLSFSLPFSSSQSSQSHKRPAKRMRMRQAAKPIVLDVLNSDCRICGKILGAGKLDKSRKSIFLNTPHT